MIVYNHEDYKLEIEENLIKVYFKEILIYEFDYVKARLNVKHEDFGVGIFIDYKGGDVEE